MLDLGNFIKKNLEKINKVESRWISRRKKMLEIKIATAVASAISKPPRRSVRSLSVQEKVQAINRVHEGESKASVARDIRVPESTLRGWCKGKEELRAIVARSRGGNHSNSDTSPNSKDDPFKKLWLPQTTKVISGSQILKAALRLFFGTVQLIIKAILYPIYGGQGERLPAIDNNLLLYSASALAHQIRTQKVTSLEVVQSFIERIKAVNPVLNCVIDNRFKDALEDAKEVDKLIASGKYSHEELQNRTPFLGVPFTTKDCIGMQGMSCTAGIYSRKGITADEDADAIALMKKAGGIPLAVTNVSELCMWWESFNPIYGRTRNAYNTNRIVGGSSGGEGCLLSAAGSPMGIGSDIGGSVRIPSFFNGVFGHKPTTGVGSLKGHVPLPSNADQKSYLLIGPMSRYASDLLPMLKVIAPNHIDALKLNEKVDIKNIRYYCMEDDTGGVLISPVDKEIKELVRKVEKYFERAHNITVQRVNLTKLKYSMAMWFAKMRIPEGSQLPVELANHQGRVNIIKELAKFPFGLSHHTLPILCIAFMEKFNPEYNSPKHLNFVNMCKELFYEFQELLKDNGVFIYPTHPTAAPYHIEPLFKPLNVGYTAVFNVLGLPSTHCPMGLNSEGLPIGVQVVGALNQDRLTLAVALELEKAFGGWVPPSTVL